MKKLAFALTLVILLSLFSGCQRTTSYTPNLPKEDIQRIEEAYARMFGHDAVWFNPETCMGRLFYCGSDNGYIILIDNAPSATFEYNSNKTTLSLSSSSSQKKTLDKDIILLRANSDTECYAFKDGEFLKLTQVYKDGLISKEAIKKAAETYNDAYT